MSHLAPDPDPEAYQAVAAEPQLVLTEAKAADVGGHTVRRALPYRARRTVGAWCFVDHMGPAEVARPEDAMGIGPHPHIGLHTVTYLTAGELRHKDSLGSDQVIRPGQLNLMTAGNGIAHAEEPTAYRGHFEGIQLWVAQPEATRHGAPAFEHHGELPRAELPNGVATVLVGSAAGVTSPARADTPLVGVDLDLRPGTAVVGLESTHEHALVVVTGAVRVDGQIVTPGHLAYLGTGRDEVAITATDAARLLLLGGEPFEAPLVMWWNFVGRSREEIVAAQTAWNAQDRERFAPVGSELGWIPAPTSPWG